MNFFTLQITSSQRVLYESDIEPESLRRLALLFASELVHYEVFRDKELFSMRIVPHWSGQPSFDKPVLLNSNAKVSPGKQSFIDIEFEEPPRPQEPVEYFTLRWHSAERNLTYQQDFSVKDTFQLPISLIVSHLLDTKKLSEDEKFKYTIFVRNEGRPSIDPVLLSKISRHTAASTQPLDTSPRPERPRNEIKVSVTGRVALIKPKPKSPTTYQNVEMVREPAAGALRIYVRRQAWQAMWSQVRISQERQVEVAGILLGNVCADENSDETFIEIVEIASVPEAQGDYYSVRIDSEVWRRIIEMVNIKFQCKTLVGWYHTHLISKLNMVQSSEETGELQASQQTFLSGDDLFIHNNFFSQSWHVALVVDLSKGREVFFYRQDKQLVDSGGFYLFDEPIV